MHLYSFMPRVVVALLTSVGLVASIPVSARCICSNDGGCCSAAETSDAACSSSDQVADACARKSCCESHVATLAVPFAGQPTAGNCQCSSLPAPTPGALAQGPSSPESHNQASMAHPAAMVPSASDAAGGFTQIGTPRRLSPLRIHALYRVWLI